MVSVGSPVAKSGRLERPGPRRVRAPVGDTLRYMIRLIGRKCAMALRLVIQPPPGARTLGGVGLVAIVWLRVASAVLKACSPCSWKIWETDLPNCRSRDSSKSVKGRDSLVARRRPMVVLPA